MHRHTIAAVLILSGITVVVPAQDAPAPLPPPPAIPAWVSSVAVKGDIRLRLEQIDDESKDDTRTRERIRARLGIEGQVTDRLLAAFQLATGDDDPVSSNQTFSDAFSRKGFGLDLAYLRYTAADDLKLYLYGGKMPKPFVSVADLVWDGDLNPEGVAATVEIPMDGVGLLVNAGAFWVEEDSASDSDDRHLLTGQAALRLPVGGFTLLLGSGVYAYQNMEGASLLTDEAKGFGNATRNVGTVDEPELVYANDFTEVEAFTELSGKIKDVPVALHAQYVVNTDADDDDTGYLVGAKLGKASKPGSFELGYNYRSLERNAVVGAFSDSDFIGGGTNGEGHKFSLGYGLAKNVQLGGTLFVNAKDPDGKDTDYTRWMLDLAAKF
jgi:hypothetical protein